MLFDIVCILIIVAGGIYGFHRGAMAQIGSIFGVILGIILCQVFGPMLVNSFVSPSENPESYALTTVFAYVVIFALAYFIGRYIGVLLKTTVNAVHLSIIDKVCGSVFTVFEYALALSLFLNAWMSVFPNTALKSNNTRVKEFVINFSPAVLGSPTVKEMYRTVSNAVGNSAAPQETSEDKDSIPPELFIII